MSLCAAFVLCPQLAAGQGAVGDAEPAGEAGSAEPAPAPFRTLRRVAIDAGHGGAEPGCIGVAGIAEKELTLSTSRALARALEGRVDWVGLSREGDETLSLEARTGWANTVDADVLVSVHYNCAANASANGVEVYFLEPTGTAPGHVVPGLEHWPPTRPVVEVGVASELPALIVEDLRRLGAMWLSARLAAHVQAALLQHTGMTDRGVRQAQFRVLRGARMPAIVAELGFLTHRVEGKIVFGEARRAAVVDGLVEGLERFDAALHASVYR